MSQIERAISASGHEKQQRENSSFYRAHSNSFHLKTEAEFILRNVVFHIKDRTNWLATAEVTLSQSQSHVADNQSVSQSVSQHVLVSSPLCGRLTRYCFLFKSLGLEFVVLSLW
jgi:hypothetical protein